MSFAISKTVKQFLRTQQWMVNVFLAASIHCGYPKWFAGVGAPTATAGPVGAGGATGLNLRAVRYPPCSAWHGGLSIWLENREPVQTVLIRDRGICKSLVPSFHGEIQSSQGRNENCQRKNMHLISF